MKMKGREVVGKTVLLREGDYKNNSVLIESYNVKNDTYTTSEGQVIKADDFVIITKSKCVKSTVITAPARSHY